jgi:hypothetical protein
VKKYLPYIAIILVFAGAATWFVKTQSPESQNQREGNFAVKEGITKIVMNDVEKRHIELTLQNGVWKVNGKYEVREELIKQLLDAVTRVTSLTPVPSNAHDNVIKAMMSKHVEVKIFTGADKPKKTYLIGGPTVDSRGTYMLLEMEDGVMATRPHIIYIPGYYGYLTPRFEMDEENWRSRLVFNETESDIQQLTVEYPDDETNSFVISRLTTDSFAVNPLDEKFRIAQTYEQKYVKQYLSFYSAVHIEAFDNNYPAKDSLMETKPYCRFNITKTDGTKKIVRLYRMPLNKRSKAVVDLAGKEISYDVDRFYASINDKDFAIVQYYIFGKLLRSYKDFYFKPKT